MATISARIGAVVTPLALKRAIDRNGGSRCNSRLRSDRQCPAD